MLLFSQIQFFSVGCITIHKTFVFYAFLSENRSQYNVSNLDHTGLLTSQLKCLVFSEVVSNGPEDNGRGS